MLKILEHHQPLFELAAILAFPYRIRQLCQIDVGCICFSTTVGKCYSHQKLFFFGYYDPNIWSNLGAAATSADRIAVTFTLNDVLYGSNGLVSNLLMGPNKFPISSNALFNNLSAPAGVNANTASLWAYGAPIDNNPVAASTSQCLVRAVDQL